MKIEVIPAILTKKKAEFEQRLAIASVLSTAVQIDIMDGLFIDNETPASLNNGNWFRDWMEHLTPGEKIPAVELHLMVINPWSFIQDWKDIDAVRRVIWHVEVPIDHSGLIDAVHELDLEAVLAINPSTPFLEGKREKGKGKSYDDLFSRLDTVLVMGVEPGFSGQDFIPDVLKTIRDLRKKYSKLPIAVDGGVNLETAPDIVKAGATRLNAAGAIFKAKNPKKAYQALGTKH